MREAKKIYKRLITVIIITGMFFVLTACGTQAPASTAAPTSAVTPESTVEPTPEPTPEPVNGELLLDDDGDGVINYKFNYKGATVYAMIVLDPSQVFVGTAIQDPNASYGNGKVLNEIAESYDAIGGINAGGFIDYDGAGSGWPPYGITYSNQVCYNSEGMGPIAGFDSNNYLWCGWYDNDNCQNVGIRDCVSFGPVLIYNGEKTAPEELETGIGARTAIGQREDGAVVMVAVDGRQGYSIGLTFPDMVDILGDKFECINAVNMDGGNSTSMYFNGELVNNSSNQAAGTRTMPDAWLIKRLPSNYVRPESVPERIVLPWDALGEQAVGRVECDEETARQLDAFCAEFLEAYYGYFGTSNADFYYPTLLQYVAPESKLKARMDLALMDRMWVNTYSNSYESKTLLGIYDNGDGTYTADYTLDMTEYASYWTYQALGTKVSITICEAPGSYAGLYAISTN